MNYRIINLNQNSPEWHEFRKRHIGASDIASIMGVSPYKTCYELYLEKTSLFIDESAPSSAMMEGQKREPEIRQWFEQETGIALMPQVIESVEFPWLSASLDGISLDGDVFVEIKFNNYENHHLAGGGKLIEHHMLQMQHQFGVLGHEAKRKGYYVSHHKGENIIVEVKADERIWDEIVEKGKEFWEMVQHKTPPKLTDRDFPLINDKELYDDSVRFTQNLEVIKKLEKENEEIKKKYIDRVGRPARIGELTLSKVEKRGNVQYESIPALQGVDLEPYRKSPTTYWTLR